MVRIAISESSKVFEHGVAAVSFLNHSQPATATALTNVQPCSSIWRPRSGWVDQIAQVAQLQLQAA